ncbi:MAG: hypothetical protein JWM57_3262 [Phycisphaerales bacterium]|nr:hypothetical protein [Phycisphaerales bacterium]
MEQSPSTPVVSPVASVAGSTELPPRRGVNLPGWLAVLILIGVAGGFGYLGWRLLRPDPAVDLSQYEPNDRRVRGGFNQNLPPQFIRPAPVVAPPPEGVTVEASGSGAARINAMSASFLVNGPKTNIVITGPQRQGIDPNDILASRVRALAMNDSVRRAAAAVTPEQIEKLGPPLLHMPQMPPVDPASRKRLQDLWDRLRAADAAARAPIQQEIMAALREIAAARIAADVAAYHAAAEQIRAVLTADQIAKLRAPTR